MAEGARIDQLFTKEKVTSQVVQKQTSLPKEIAGLRKMFRVLCRTSGFPDTGGV